MLFFFFFGLSPFRRDCSRVKFKNKEEISALHVKCSLINLVLQISDLSRSFWSTRAGYGPASRVINIIVTEHFVIEHYHLSLLEPNIMSASGDHDLRDLSILKNETTEVIASIEAIKTAPKTKDNIQLLRLETNELRGIMERYRECVYSCNGNLDPNVEEDKKISDTIWNDYKTFNRAAKMAITQGQVIIDEFQATTKRESLPSLIEAQPTTSYRPKLPDIDVPRFDGTLVEFPEFKSLFESLIHNNETVPKAGKMHYLKQALIKDASATLKDMPETAEIYDEAWALVCQNYENYKAIIRQHLDNLFAIPRIESKNEISNLLLKVRRILKGVRVCGENPDQWSTIISYIVSERLDKKTYEDFENTLESKLKFPTWEQLEKFLKIRESSVPRTSDLKNRKPSPKENENHSRRPQLTSNQNLAFAAIKITY